MKPGHTGFTRLFKATQYSVKGLRAAWMHESAFRQECTIALILTPLAFWLGRSTVEVVLLIGVCALVLVTELLNSAVEAVVDRAGEEHHDLAGRAKDMGSAAVAIALLLVIITWGMIAWQRLA
ncbi:MAG: diacylglycerol kinase [Pseudomonadales bacterium]|jgi:diacylglycerol kinase (ATP)|nr:diacylglycerol kinase [Pseudomonadales bacterium]MDP6471898.1 diacylglycerol kinase [Pseudomonadales bacterium]MDP6826832.1 diacylglycerol kinase [Pseudomonadales bacterium]MDP6970890.1 diacylglycerol kinase [Pseudomonadales bacterium]|tara:strand:- start:464 stop:832 length:369 start_codon:yes stop_codon:yes gene_type:complete